MACRIASLALDIFIFILHLQCPIWAKVPIHIEYIEILLWHVPWVTLQSMYCLHFSLLLALVPKNTTFVCTSDRGGNALVYIRVHRMSGLRARETASDEMETRGYMTHRHSNNQHGFLTEINMPDSASIAAWSNRDGAESPGIQCGQGWRAEVAVSNWEPFSCSCT